jgi:hypothetical protein
VTWSAQRKRVIVVGAVGALGALVAFLLAPDNGVAPLVLIAAAIVIGEYLELRTGSGNGLPLSNALMLMVAAGTTEGRAAAVIGGSVVVAALLGRPGAESPSLRARLGRLGERLLTGVATVGAYGLVSGAASDDSLGVIVGALGAAALAQLAVDEGVRFLRHEPTAIGQRGKLAWLALGSSGMLMALGYRGVDGDGQLGLWGAALFGMPLLATWFSFERFDSASRTHEQTIDALSRAPELGGLVRDGHAARVAVLASELAETLGVDEPQREQLVTAAKLHHLGVVTLDDPDDPAHRHSPAVVAKVTAGMLGEIERLEPASRIVAGEPLSNRARAGNEGPMLASKILKVASAYDDLTEGDPAHSEAALEVLFSGPGYVYDSAVLLALERVLERRDESLVPAS